MQSVVRFQPSKNCGMGGHAPVRYHKASHRSRSTAATKSFIGRRAMEHVPRAAAVDGVPGEEPAPLAWYERPCAWKTLESFEEMVNAINEDNGRYTAIDFFAGACPSCKGAFPGLCKIPKDKALASKVTFLKANVQDDRFARFIKKQGVTSIPYLLVFHPDGRQLIGMNASFKKVKQVKGSIQNIIANPDAEGFALDQTYTAQPVTRAAAEQAAAEAATAAAAMPAPVV